MARTATQFYGALSLALGAALAGGGPARAEPAEAAVRAVVTADNHLGFELYRRLAEKPGNVVMSPHSIATAVGIALAGARGETGKEMAAALRFDLPAGDLADARRQLDATLNRESASGGALVQVATALHLTRLGYLVDPAFKQFLTDRYGAQIFEGSDLSAINGWVKQRTNGRIEQILTKLEPYSVCVLLNAIYFKGTWDERFDKRATHPEDFHLATGDVVQATTMRQQGYFQVLRAHAYDAIRLPYRRGGLAMVIVVPARGDGLGELEAGLDAQSAELIFAGLAHASREKLDLSLPSFKVELGADLISPLQNLGVKLAFDRDRADFSGITGSTKESDRIHISQIQHRAFVDVNEDGTEAAAATAVEFAARAAPGLPAAFKIDRPFLYFIVDEASDAILFVGRIKDPRNGAAPDADRR
jgi:serpin B